MRRQSRQSTSRGNTWPTTQRGLVNRNTRTHTLMEDNPWTDTDRRWSQRPLRLSWLPAASPDPRQFGNEQVVEVAEEPLPCCQYCPSPCNCLGTVQAQRVHTYSQNHAGKSIEPWSTGSQSLAAPGRMEADWLGPHVLSSFLTDSIISLGTDTGLCNTRRVKKHFTLPPHA